VDEREIVLDSEEGENESPASEKPKAIASGKVVKEALFKRFTKSIFVAGPKEVKESIIKDVLYPAVKDFFADCLYSIVDVAIYGRDGGGHSVRRGKGRSGTSRTPYDDISTANAKRGREVRRTSSRYEFDDIWFDDRRLCDEVYDGMLQEIEEHGFCSVYYYFELAGVTAVHTDQNWGWYSLEGTGYKRTQQGWGLKLPDPEQRRRD
jgi:hypothetical protein